MGRSVLGITGLALIISLSTAACGPSAGVASGGPTTAGTPTATGAAPTSSVVPGTTPSGAGTDSGSVRYVTYHNARFGFSVAVPASFTADTPPEDGDGLSYSADGGRVTVTVYGDNNVRNSTVAGAEAAFVAREKAKHARITLSTVSGDAYTVSGYDQAGTSVWYEHMIVESNVDYGIDWTYPTSLAGQVDPEVTESVHSYVPGPDHTA